MKLTDKNIEELYIFTRQHYVEHYDVQTELVDHLANDIEAICDKNPNLSFEQARDISFKKFGVFGFMDVVEQKSKQVGKRYRKVLWDIFKEWFQLPKLATTLSLIFLFYTLLRLPSIGVYFYYTIIGIYLIYFFTRCRILIVKHKRKVKETGKNWLLEDIIFKLASSNFLILFSNMFNIFRLSELLQKMQYAFLVAVFLVLLLLVGYITLVVIPNKSEKLLEEQYPEYKLV
ncbi:hypothetical protein EV195_10773 [Tenacibaculum skagerrakense]|uniref:Uncharacterized protein n=1 Tax=Tenacibaculum skagerrakense TaxID=186571 RepID=A0A4R2NR93_9FLAO|nr:hypothetical protein [Tenacibaculum skagerrakense]TCP23908.1 hypothetical protein EV195_10773 [Tenacibaculum skagerrakense]